MRQRILDQIVSVVEPATRDKSVISVKREARRIFEENPQSPLSIVEIAAQISRLAIKAQRPVQLKG